MAAGTDGCCGGGTDGREHPPTDGCLGRRLGAVLLHHQQDPATPVTDLRTLGPQVAMDEVLVVPDEVCTRKTIGGFWELRTARVTTTAGTRYVSGTGSAFLTVLLAVALACAGRDRRLLVLADGARWIRAWVTGLADRGRPIHLLLDWFHLRKRCREWASMFCAGREAKAELLRSVERQLWRGDVDAAIALLEAYRPQARNGDWLDKLVAYLHERRPFIPNYAERRRTRQYILSITHKSFARVRRVWQV